MKERLRDYIILKKKTIVILLGYWSFLVLNINGWYHYFNLHSENFHILSAYKDY